MCRTLSFSSLISPPETGDLLQCEPAYFILLYTVTGVYSQMRFLSSEFTFMANVCLSVCLSKRDIMQVYFIHSFLDFANRKILNVKLNSNTFTGAHWGLTSLHHHSVTVKP